MFISDESLKDLPLTQRTDTICTTVHCAGLITLCSTIPLEAAGDSDSQLSLTEWGMG